MDSVMDEFEGGQSIDTKPTLSICGQVIEDDVPVLLPLLRPIWSDWNVFGVHLVGSETVQQIIEEARAQQKGVREKLADVVVLYAKTDGANWEAISRALEKIGNHNLASRIRRTGPIPSPENEDFVAEMMDQYCLEEISSAWHAFGVQLEIPDYELKCIDIGRTVTDMMSELLIRWITIGENVNVSAIIEACEKAGNPTLSNDLKNNEDIQSIMNRPDQNADMVGSGLGAEKNGDDQMDHVIIGPLKLPKWLFEMHGTWILVLFTILLVAYLFLKAPTALKGYIDLYQSIFNLTDDPQNEL